jgi:hypothetical protein
LTFEASDLQDLMRILVLINFKRSCECTRETLRYRLQRFLGCISCIEGSDFDNSLRELSSDGLISVTPKTVQLTEKGERLSRGLQSLFFRKEPILELVAGLTDGSITGLVIILSAFLGGLSRSVVIFAAALTLTAVSLTGFSSLLLGGKTEDIADLISLKALMEYGFYNISDNKERDKSLLLIKSLFNVLQSEINRSNLISATISGATAMLSGLLPVLLFTQLPSPLGLLVSLAFVGLIVMLFLVRYRSRKTQVHWKITLVETLGIITVAVVVSLLLSGFKFTP